MLNTWNLKWLGKKWDDIQAEIAQTGGEIGTDIIFPPGKEAHIGDLRIIRIKKEKEKLNFTLTRDKF
ncbi:hypothetical protein Sgly_2264 [Syntrophobotulus glycolicus DSM 8271]|uniref:Uncharacterized protein n=1 Tax=Syntrophobotulus glycolicus (strain DSM 8271 / FlGlyR) TaxID=645991 RepID=F0SUA3_SYNGF|nr:hypothetical protein [Syntrophobotulus glycolicus]ADY56553.1 hypothetical protein Sgly_2264 [Syntrophobotulus glycolicus DSM 8271]